MFPGWGSPREPAVAVHRLVVEAEDDLADPVALGLRLGAQGLEPVAGDQLGDEDVLAAEVGDHVRDADERVASVDPRHRPVVGGLELVVELVDDPGADLLADRLDVELRGHPPREPQEHAEVLHVGSHRVGDARVLDLDRDAAPVEQGRPVDLADRGGGDRLGIELGEVVVERSEVGLDHRPHAFEGDRRRRVAELRELDLELVAVGLGHEPEVDEGEDLADLHRRALHPAEDLDDPLCGLQLAALERRLRALVGADHVRGPRSRLAHGGARGGAADPRQPLDPPGGQVALGHGGEC